MLAVEETLILCALAFFFCEYTTVFIRNINVNRLNLTTGVQETIRGRSEGLECNICLHLVFRMWE